MYHASVYLQFFSRYLKGQVFKFNHCIDQLIKRLSVHADGQSLVLMKDYIHDVTTDIISQVRYIALSKLKDSINR